MPVSRGATSPALNIGQLNLVDQLIRSNRKTISIQIQRDGQVLVRAPLRAPEHLIRAFVESKRDWINEKKLLAAQSTVQPARKFAQGETFLLLGKPLPLRVVTGQTVALSLQESGLCLSSRALPRAQAVFEAWYKAQAARVFAERAQFFAARHGFRYEKLRITSARTRWGSCSSRGVLSFTWRLVMAPLDVLDYVVIHELAHLKVKNHSAVFWAEVARLMPDYKSRRDWLKKNGHLLTLDGDA